VAELGTPPDTPGVQLCPGGIVAASEYTPEDLVNTVRVLSVWWFLLFEYLPEPFIDASADPLTASLINQQQSVLQTLAQRADLPAELLHLRLDGEHEFSLAASILRKRLDEDRITALRDCVDQSMQLLLAGADLARLRRGKPQPATGTVQGLFRSRGGVPKHAVETVEVGARGVMGDVQKTRQHHGRPWQALCVWSAEVVNRLHTEGHPIVPGSAGENISIGGLDWDVVLPGSKLTIGPVVVELSLYALPCAKNAQWFADRNFERIHHRTERGVSRIYGSVLHGGPIRVGDPVSLW
jgi:MOSC domain-containing protein YiiM